MFASIKRGFSFLGQAVDLARKDRDLLKPSFISLIVSAIVAVIGAVPLIAVAILGSGSDFTQYILYVLGALLIFAQYVVAYIFSGMTAYLIYGYLTEGDGRMDKAWAIVRRDMLDIASLAAASTVVKLVENALRGRRGRGNIIGGVLASILDTIWTTATYFVLPAMVIEDLNLPAALKRATYIIKNNLLLVTVTEIGVSTVVGLSGFLLVLAALALGVVIFVVLVNVHLILALAVAVPVAGLLIAVITAFTSYVTTAYHTCLFLWAREAERAVSQGYTVQSAAVPAPLAAVLGRA
jgi:hypothetical protein